MAAAPLSRRAVLGATAGALGIGLGGALVPATASAGGHPDLWTPRPTDPGLPDVPGMAGDRRANELWWRLDEATLYHPTPEFTAAYLGIAALYGNSWDVVVVRRWLEMVRSPQYPRDFAAYMAPARPHLEVMSRVQLEVFDSVYRPGDPRLAPAFAWFAQGLLLDPRTGNLHIMTGRPPGGYPVWHVVLRAMMVLGVDSARWGRLAPLNAFGCWVQLAADPDLENLNQPLPQRTVRRLAGHWLRRTPRQLDVDFLSFPYPDAPPAT
jgi:hypothetical protein